MRSPRRPAGPIVSASVVVLLVVGVLSGCSSSSSSMSTQDCVTKYKAAASTFNSTARTFAMATSNGTPNAEFPTFAAKYADATKVFDSTLSAMDCGTKVNAAFSSIIAANEGLLPFIQQFADGKLPPAAEFNAANQKLATAVTEANDLLGVTK